MADVKTSKALRFTGLIGDVKHVEIDIPSLPPNEILIKVHAASINPIDLQLYRNALLATVKNDKGLGRDFSGSVVAVGRDVKGWNIGDDIYGLLFEVVSFITSNFEHPLDNSIVWSRHICRVYPPGSIGYSCG